jgi:signal transduction histidine kinase
LVDEAAFARLVSLACHDLRTPLATVNGFARTLERTVPLEPPADRYVGMIAAAADQLDELIDELSLVARIRAGRYEPPLRDVGTLVLAQGAVDRLGADRVTVEGEGATVQVDVDATGRGVAALVQSVLRHGGLEHTTIRVAGAELVVEGVTDASAPVVLGEELRDLGAAVAVQLIEELGGSVTREGSLVRIRLPQ